MSAKSFIRKGLIVFIVLIVPFVLFADYYSVELQSYSLGLSTTTSTTTTNIINNDKSDIDRREPRVVLIVGSNRTGTSWLLQQLKQSTFAMCSEPYDVLEPDWERLGYTSKQQDTDDAAVKMCSYAFIIDGIHNLTNLVNISDPESDVERCRDKDNSNNHGPVDDPWKAHLPRLCRWIERLDRNYSDAHILDLWVTAYVENDDTLLQCECSNEMRPIKGLKIATEWLPRWPVESWNPPDVNLNNTQLVRSSKIIYLHRSNLFDRYYGSLVATLLEDPESSINQVEVDTEAMLGEFPWMEYFDQSGRAWVKDHAGDDRLKDIDYEICRKQIFECLEDIASFLEISPVGGANSKRISNVQRGKKENSMKLENISNIGEVSEALAAYGYGHMIKTPEVASYKPLNFWIYEEDPFRVQSRQFKGIKIRQIWGENNWKEIAVLLQQTHPEDIIVVGDSRRDASTNFLYRPLAAFKKHFAEMTKDFSDAIVAAATIDCCVNALSHLDLGGLFNENATSRTSRTCNSSVDSCPWDEDGKGQEWQSFMKDLAANQRGSLSQTVYLDAGFLVGTASNLFRIIELADIQSSEDATAVLTDLMFRRPELVLLDYEQRLFGYFRPDPLVSFETNCSIPIEQVRMKMPSSTLKSMFLQNEPQIDCVAGQVFKTPYFPMWNDEGIELNPILDHIQRVADKSGRLKGIDMTFGPEVPYFIDESGLWTSKQIRGRVPDGITRWRLEPIEKVQKLGYELLMESIRNNSTRWSALKHVLENGGFPFFGWYGDFKHCAYLNFEKSVSIPVLTNSATLGCGDAVPIPSYQQVFDARTDRYTGMFREYKSKYTFDSKIRKVVWRGALSTNDVAHAFTSIRWRLCETVHQSGSEMFDVGLTKIPKHNQRATANLTQVGDLAPTISPMAEFQRYWAILDMDGNSWSSRFGSLLCFNSVVIKVQPIYVDYFFFDLKPWTHYIPVRDDLSDLFQNAAFALDPENEEIIKDIIASANQWCAERFSPSQLAHDMVDIFESYVLRLNHGDSKWLDTWTRRKTDFLEADWLKFAVI
jgi:hypothetical protein